MPGETMTLSCMRAGPRAIGEAANVIRSGGIVAVPTDTVYGLACDPWSDKAVQALFEAKSRSSKPVPVLCSDIGVAARIVELNPTARRLAEAQLARRAHHSRPSEEAIR